MARGTAAPRGGLDRFLCRLHAALTVGEVQVAYLSGIEDVVWARGHGIYRLDPATQRPTDVAGRVPDGFLDEYERHGRRGDPIFQFVQTKRRPIDNTRLLAERDWQQQPVYEVLRRAHFGHSMEAPICSDGALVGTLNMARAPDDPPFGDADLVLLATISRHVAVALRRVARFEQTERLGCVLQEALDALPQALVISELDGRSMFTNRAAESLAATYGHGLLDASGGCPVRDNVRRLAEGRRRTVLAAPAQAEGSSESRESVAGGLTVQSTLLPRRHASVVSIVYPRARSCRPPVEWTPLSRRECELVELVGRGLNTRQIAAEACISQNTVKQHLKRIFRKLRVSSRAELIQAVWQTGAGHPPAGAAGVPLPARLQIGE